MRDFGMLWPVLSAVSAPSYYRSRVTRHLPRGLDNALRDTNRGQTLRSAQAVDWRGEFHL
jgi:hypothetical protein